MAEQEQFRTSVVLCVCAFFLFLIYVGALQVVGEGFCRADKSLLSKTYFLLLYKKHTLPSPPTPTKLYMVCRAGVT